jgi:hypothetical protein
LYRAISEVRIKIVYVTPERLVKSPALMSIMD